MNNDKGTPKDLMEAIHNALEELGITNHGAAQAIYKSVRERLAQDAAILAGRVGADAEDMVIATFHKKYPLI